MKSTQIYLHAENTKEPKLIEVLEERTLIEIIKEHNIIEVDEIQSEELYVFLEDNDEPLLLEHTIEKHEIKRRAHIHCHRCHRIEVTIIYNGKSFTIKVAPSTTGTKLLKMAITEFKITQSDAADLEFQFENKEVFPLNAHIGSFVKYPNCKVILYLVPIKKIQG